MYNRYEFSDPFSVCFNMMKMKYAELDEALTSSSFLTPTDRVNIFISLESVYKNISTIQDLEQKIFLQKDFKQIIISNILNLAAHYKYFFISNRMDVRIYLYQTDFNSDNFKQRKYIDDFRSYYLVKFNENPKFSYFTDLLKEEILEELKIYCQFIPRVYFINSHNIEGSIIPYLVAMDDPTRKNLVFGNDVIESQYSFMPNFMYFYIQRSYKRSYIFKKPLDYISSIFKKPAEEIVQYYNFMTNDGIYASLLSIMGNRLRSIDGIGGIGPMKFASNIRELIAKKTINPNTTNARMLCEFLSGDDKEQFVKNYYCTSLNCVEEDVNESEKISILSQRKDKLDMNSLMALNNTRFKLYPLLLDALSH